MDVFDRELLAFWQSLNRNTVRYIMVGGVASILHGHNRMTEDIDVWMERLQIVPGWTYFH